MPRQRQIRLVQDRIVKAGVGDARLQIVRDQLGDRAAPGVEHPHMTAEPVFGGLRPRRFRVNDGGERQRANEDADLTYAIGRRHRHGHAGVIDLAHLRRQNRSPHPRFGRSKMQMLPIAPPELAVAVAIRMLIPVLLPHQQQRHRGLAQLRGHRRPVRLRPRRRRLGLREQQRLDLRLAFAGDVLVAHTGSFGAR